jgi:hypothetical protein
MRKNILVANIFGKQFVQTLQILFDLLTRLETLCSLTCKNDYTITGLTPRPTPAFRTYVDGGTLYDTSDSTHPTSTASQLTSVAPRELSVSEARAEGSTTVAMTRKVSLLRAAASTPDAPAGEPRLVLAQDLIPNID